MLLFSDYAVQQFLLSIRRASEEALAIALDKGFVQLDAEGALIPRNKAELICLMHSELSEMLEGTRKPGPDVHCPEFSSEEIELADLLIRAFNYAREHNLRLGEAVIAKMRFNTSREYKHGKEF
jgi:NTP pyrophosphatase (non-canonical NTP hydrolase)